MENTEAYFVFLDCLGFKKLYEGIPQRTGVSSDEKGRMRDFLSYFYSTGFVEKLKAILHVDGLGTKLSTVLSSDSLFAWSNGNTPDDLGNLSYFAKRVLNLSFVGGGIPLRGAITFGEIAFSKQYDSGLNWLESTVVGDPVNRATNIEKVQDWSGVAIDTDIVSHAGEDVVNSLVKQHILAKYPVPIKKEFAEFVSFDTCVHWTSNIAGPDREKIIITSVDEERIRKQFEIINEDVPHSKLENTVTFLKKMTETPK
jgi:hypothetical protein